MLPNLSVMEWAAIGGGAVTVLLLGGWGVLAARLEAFNGSRFATEVSVPVPADEERWAEYMRTRWAKLGQPGVLPPAPVEPVRRGLLARLRARNERILREREARRG